MNSDWVQLVSAARGSEPLSCVYHPAPSSFLAARLAFIAAFLALPPLPAFSCCFVSFGSAHHEVTRRVRNPVGKTAKRGVCWVVCSGAVRGGAAAAAGA